MAFDNTPNKLDAAFVQRDHSNQYYEQINISGSNLVVYLDETGSLTADKVSVWATKYGIGSGGGPSISASWASSSISSSYTLTASFALNGGGTGGTSDSASWVSASVHIILADTASYFITSSVTSASYAISTSYAPNLYPQVDQVTVPSASWVSSSAFITTSQTASYYNGSVVSASYAGTASVALNAVSTISASWASSSFSASYTPYAVTASYAYTSSVELVLQTSSSWSSASLSSSHADTASYVATASYYPPDNPNAISASWVSASAHITNADTASYFITSSVTSASYAISASWAPSISAGTQVSCSWASQSLSASYAPFMDNPNSVSASWASSSLSASISNTASYVETASYYPPDNPNAVSASWVSSSVYIKNADTASYVTSASYYPSFPTAVSSASWVSSSVTIDTASYALTASFAINGGGTTLSSSWASSSLSASWSIPQLGAVTIIHDDGTISIYNPSSDTDIERGLSLLTASVNLASKDVIYLANSTYDISNSNIDLSNNNLFFGVSLVGSGKYSTRIKSSRSIVDSANTVILQLGNASIVRDLSIICNASASLYQLPIGTYSTTFSQSIIRDIYINNGSDGIYLNSGNSSSLTAYNVTVDSLFDCLTVGVSFFTGDFYNCVFSSSHGLTDPFPGTQLRAVVVHSSTAQVNLWNCKLNIDEGVGVGGAYGVLQTFGTTNIYGGSISTNGSTNVYDVFNGGGAIGVTSNLVYNPAKVSGSLTYLDTQQIYASINNIVSSSISASYAPNLYPQVAQVTVPSASWVSASAFITTAQTASYVLQSVSASYAPFTQTTQTTVPSASWVSASVHVTNSDTASYFYSVSGSGAWKIFVSGSGDLVFLYS